LVVGLQVYRKKRDFEVTPEPRGRTQRAEAGRYVIQKHDAKRLHYDLRLEFDGVMKSWAVTRGPSLVPGEKRLAIHVEDHPIEYNTFEGTIPKGQYGGGTVMVWDRGHWSPVGDPHKAYRKGHLIFVLDGEKLKGRWHLVRMRKRANERQDPWLLIKADDEAARGAGDQDVLEEQPRSVVTGRSIPEIAEGRGGNRVWQSNRNGESKKSAKKSAKKPVKKSAQIPAAKATGSSAKPRLRVSAKTSKSAKKSKAATAKSPARAATATTATKTSKLPAPRRKAYAPHAGVDGGKERARETAVRLTHPDRVYWADVGVTKQGLADYYGSVWDWMAPQVVGRPLALVRCPEGTKGQCFFQKHAAAGLDEKALRTVIDPKGRQVIAVEDLDGVLSLVQAGVLEIHVRGATIDRLDVCDRIVFDLDPGEGVGWSAMVAAARDVRERLAGLKLESFVKLSGGKGLHVVLPIDGADWESAKSFAQALALAMAADEPDRYLAKITKSLRKGKIFIDYLRNSLEQTSVAAYSTRAREGAPVAAPVSWAELGRTAAADQYTVLDLMKRLRRLKQDPWQDIGRVRQKLPITPATG
jgi:bifunctional non-homologous end joining protein LigD